MKSIFKGSNFVIQWEIINAVTSLPFDFKGLFVNFVIYSNDYNNRIANYKLSENKLQAEIAAETLPAGVYDMLLEYIGDKGEKAKCMCKNAFQITRNPECCTGDNVIVLSSYAAPLSLPDLSNNYVGHFASEMQLPGQEKAGWALVGDIQKSEPYFYYTAKNVPFGFRAGWNNLKDILGIYDLTANPQAETTVINRPDGEDITEKNGLLKIKDRMYSPTSYSGMGFFILRQNFVEGKNILTQTMFPSSNTVYEIRYDFDLNGETFELPENIILDFQGGSLNNGTLFCKNTIIKGHSSGTVDYTGYWIYEHELANKDYKPEYFSGLGRVSLPRNIVELTDEETGERFKINLLTQGMLSLGSTRYIIQYDFDLNGAEITIPEGCVLEFQGGSLSNGKLVGNNTLYEKCYYQIFKGIEFEGTFQNSEVDFINFGGVGNNDTDNVGAFEMAVNFLSCSAFPESEGEEEKGGVLKIHSGKFVFNSEITIPNNISVIGTGNKTTNLIFPQSNGLTLSSYKDRSNTTIKDFQIKGSGSTDAEGNPYVGVRMHTTNIALIQSIAIISWGVGVDMNKAVLNTFIDIFIGYCGTAIIGYGGSYFNRWYGGMITACDKGLVGKGSFDIHSFGMDVEETSLVVSGAINATFHDIHNEGTTESTFAVIQNYASIKIYGGNISSHKYGFSSYSAEGIINATLILDRCTFVAVDTEYDIPNVYGYDISYCEYRNALGNIKTPVRNLSLLGGKEVSFLYAGADIPRREVIRIGDFETNNIFSKKIEASTSITTDKIITNSLVVSDKQIAYYKYNGYLTKEVFPITIPANSTIRKEVTMESVTLNAYDDIILIGSGNNVLPSGLIITAQSKTNVSSTIIVWFTNTTESEITLDSSFGLRMKILS